MGGKQESKYTNFPVRNNYHKNKLKMIQRPDTNREEASPEETENKNKKGKKGYRARKLTANTPFKHTATAPAEYELEGSRK